MTNVLLVMKLLQYRMAQNLYRESNVDLTARGRGVKEL